MKKIIFILILMVTGTWAFGQQMFTLQEPFTEQLLVLEKEGTRVEFRNNPGLDKWQVNVTGSDSVTLWADNQWIQIRPGTYTAFVLDDFVAALVQCRRLQWKGTGAAQYASLYDLNLLHQWGAGEYPGLRITF